MKEVSLWFERWFLSSNAKDIGTLYLIFSLFSGLIGTAFSILIRLELSGPGVQYIADNQLYNSIITAHAIVMIFFMVKFFILHYDLDHKLLMSIAYEGNESTMEISNNNDNANNKPKYIKIEVKDPYNNRDKILKISKGEKGVYVWESLDGKYKYVGHSINLYNRISSYFMPSILKTKARKVLRYFNKHGFSDIVLTIYIMDPHSSIEEVVGLEQLLIDTLNPNLNVDLVAKGSGYHAPMSEENRKKLRKERGVSIYIYDVTTLTLLHIFESKTHMYNNLKIHHKSLSTCLLEGTLYLDFFLISLDLITESLNTNLLTLEEISKLVSDKRAVYIKKHPAAKVILAEYKNDPKKNIEFSSLTSLANHLKGDRTTIRQYLKGEKLGHYRGVWTFTYKK